MNSDSITVEDLGLIDYRKAWEYQEERFGPLVEYKRDHAGKVPPGQYLIFCEHPHVFTLGKSGDEKNLLIREEFLKKIGATYYRTDRGGDITYHGPGQIVGYPIVDLERLGMGLKQYIRVLEESVIRLLKGYGVKAERKKGATGVWLEPDQPSEARKICAIGVRSSRHITMHGMALNVNTDLDYFSYINPCGFEFTNVTSLSRELGRPQDMNEVRGRLRDELLQGLLSPGNQGS